MRTSFEAAMPPGRRHMSPSRSNVVLLAALGLLTGAGSSLFIFAASIGQDQVELSPVAASLAFSLNAVAGLVATRRRTRDGSASLWLGAIVLCAGAVAFSSTPVVFLVAMAVWGYAFWKAVPTVLGAVASWSLVPEERTGDAQGIMAFGRVVGPVVGGALLTVGSFTAVGIGAVAGLASSAMLVGTVHAYRHRHPERRPAGPDGGRAADTE
jgi:DHA1 family inner membrane transport protein